MIFPMLMDCLPATGDGAVHDSLKEDNRDGEPKPAGQEPGNTRL